MGTRQNRLIEAVLTCTHNICFGQKYENSQKNSTENCHFYGREKSLYIAWACFRNEIQFCFFLHKNLICGCLLNHCNSNEHLQNRFYEEISKIISEIFIKCAPHLPFLFNLQLHHNLFITLFILRSKQIFALAVQSVLYRE